MSETFEDGLKRESPDVHTLIRVLGEAGVNYVVTGSAAAMLHGVTLVPGDLDITPALDVDNLTRLAAVLESIEARQDPNAPFGHWQRETTASSTGSRSLQHRKLSRRERAGCRTQQIPPHSTISCSQNTEHSMSSQR